MIGSICFGFTAVILRLGVKNQDIFYGINLRILGSIPFLMILTVIIDGPNFYEPYLSLNNLTLIFTIAMFLLTGDLMLMRVLKYRPIGVIAPLIAVSPLFTILLLLFTHEANITTKIVLLTFVIVFGIGLVTYEPSTTGKGFDLLSLSVGLFIALLWGFMLYFEIHLLQKDGVDSFSFAATKFIILGLIGFILFSIQKNRDSYLHHVKVNREDPKEHNKTRNYLLLAGFVGWFLGSVLVYTALNDGPVPIITPIIGLNPLFAVIISLLLGHEQMGKSKLCGVLLCVVSSIFLVS